MKQRITRTYELSDDEIRSAIETYVVNRADLSWTDGQLVTVRHQSLPEGDSFSYGLSATVQMTVEEDL